MHLECYLNFDGRGEEAINYYKEKLGAQVEVLMRFRDNPECETAPGTEDKVMHASLKIGQTRLLLSDCHNTGKPAFQGFTLTLTVDSDADAQKYFDRLAEGGKIVMPISKTFFATSFGVVADHLGVHWNIIHPIPM